MRERLEDKKFMSLILPVTKTVAIHFMLGDDFLKLIPVLEAELCWTTFALYGFQVELVPTVVFVL